MEEQKTFSKSEKRWIAREVISSRMTMGEVKEHFTNQSKNPEGFIRNWLREYQPVS